MHIIDRTVTEKQSCYVATIRGAETTVIISATGVAVYHNTAAARAWSRCGYGKHFETIADAIAGYKSAKMKAFLKSIKQDQEPTNVIQFA
jgi:hypothetical protein